MATRSIDYVITPSNADMVQVRMTLFRPIKISIDASGNCTTIANEDLSSMLNATILSSYANKFYTGGKSATGASAMTDAVYYAKAAATSGTALDYSCLVLNATYTGTSPDTATFSDTSTGVVGTNTVYYGGFVMNTPASMSSNYANAGTFNRITNNVYGKIGREVGDDFVIKPLALLSQSSTVTPYIMLMEAWDVNAVSNQGTSTAGITGAATVSAVQKVFVYNSTIPLSALSMGEGNIALAIN